MPLAQCRHGRCPPKAAYRAAVAANKMGSHIAVPFLLAQVRHLRCNLHACTER